MTRLYLVRHGEVDGFDEKRYNGQANVPLTANGRAQLDALCRSLACRPLRAVYSSDLDRCVYGAEQLGRRMQLPVYTDAALRELHCGSWQGRIWATIQQEDPDAWQARLRDIVHYRFPGGESFHDAAERVRPVVQAMVERHAGQSVALFGHGGVNRVILLDALGASLDRAFVIEQDYACLNIIDYHADGRCRVRLMNGPCPEGLAPDVPGLTPVG